MSDYLKPPYCACLNPDLVQIHPKIVECRSFESMDPAILITVKEVYPRALTPSGTVVRRDDMCKNCRYSQPT